MTFAIALSALWMAAPAGAATTETRDAATAPETTITSGPPQTRDFASSTAAFALSSTATAPVYECRLDGGAWLACDSTPTYTDLSEGSHRFEARSADGPGGPVDATPATHVWVVDTTPPAEFALISPADGATVYGTDVELSWEPAADAHLRRYDAELDGHAERVGLTSVAASELVANGGVLAEGVHTWRVQAEDDARNTRMSETRTFTVVHEPDTTITKGPSNIFTGYSRSSTATFELDSTATAPVYECRLDGAAWDSCDATVTYEGLADGMHTFEARSAEGPDGDFDQTPATGTWGVDTTPPTGENLYPADGATVYSQDGTIDLAWQLSDSGSGVSWRNLQLTLDGDPHFFEDEDGLKPTGYRAVVAAGLHEWSVRVPDRTQNGYNSGLRTFTMVIDATPPNAIALLAPAHAAVTADATPTLSWQPASDATSPVVEQHVRIDGGAWTAVAPDAGAFTPAAGLAQGVHSWSVMAEDAAGNRRESPTRTFVVDTTSPLARLTISPSPAGVGQSVRFDGSASSDAVSHIVRWEWDLDGNGSFETDTGATPTVSRSYETAGTRTVRLRVTDAAGHTATLSGPLVIRRGTAAGGRPGVLINGGARFTNDPNVTLTVGWPALATAILVSNDRRFAAAVTHPLASEIPWVLDTSGKRRMKRVYVRFPGTGVTVHDDIVLDETPPRIASATATRSAKGYRVAVRAGDSTSGLDKVEVTGNRGRAGAVRRASRTLHFTTRVRPRWARVSDRAGNRSSWRRVVARR
jgi:hypothetical protein